MGRVVPPRQRGSLGSVVTHVRGSVVTQARGYPAFA
jgi:hypothetical protein